MAGIFPKHIRRRHERYAAPGLRYYEEMGRMNFRVAGDSRPARKHDLSRVFHGLADSFRVARLALNDLSERLVLLES